MSENVISEDAKLDIQARLKAVAASMPGFRSRIGQRTMIAEVAKAFGRHPDLPETGKEPVPPVPGSTLLCVQGGTGVGKSLGYSVPGAIMAKRKGKRLLISTATVALQEQLTQKDLPMFFKASGLTLSIELAKGRTRYVCNYRLQQAERDMQQATMFGREDRPGQAADNDEAIRKIIEKMTTDFSKGSWNGDRDLWPSVDDRLWSAVTTDRHGCLGMNCPSVRSCAQVDAKKRLKAADVIVANHDLVLADLAMGGGKVLPAPSECFYIFDEGHHLPEKAVSAFASSHLLESAHGLAQKVVTFGGTLGKTLGVGFRSGADEIDANGTRLAESLDEALRFFGSLAQLTPTEKVPSPKLDFPLSCIPEEFFSLGGNIQSAADALMKQLRTGSEALVELAGSDPARKALFDKLIADAGFYIGRLDEIAQTWHLFLEQPAIDQPPIAKWVEGVSGRNGVDYRISASPVRAAGFLRANLWEKAAGAVVTSATLKTLGNFDHFLMTSGLNAYPQLPCIDLPSSFDYYSQGTLEIPAMRSLPANYAVHTEEVTERLGGLFASLDGGMLVLFTSKKQMNEVAGLLAPAMRERVLVQGASSKSNLIAAHKASIDGGKPSVIFGLESFSEGVDLAGRYCTRVVITKLPFDVPDDPVLKTLADWIEKRGGNAFMEISVPAAARKLEQRAGRLIRSETDRGEVIVMDMRLWDKQYGKQMLRGLPPFRLLVKGNEVTF